MAGLSIRGYAGHRGVSHTAVRKAIATGRITAGADGKIDPSLADAQWRSSTDPSKPSSTVAAVPKLRRIEGAASEPLATPGWEETPATSEGSGAPRLASSYAASRAAREAYLARLAKLDFEQRSGKLIDADQVRAQVFALGRRARDTLLGIPDRLAPVLAGQSDPAAIHKILADEIIASLAELSGSSPLKVAGGKEPGR